MVKIIGAVGVIVSCQDIEEGRGRRPQGLQDSASTVIQ